MAINKAENTLDNRLVKEVAALQRQQREIRTVQPTSGDAIEVIASPIQSSIFTLAFLDVHYETVTLQPSPQQLVLAELAFTLYVDTKDNAHIWPSFGTYQDFLGTVVSWQEQTSTADDATGLKRYLITVLNDDVSNTHTYYLDSKVYYPKIATA